MGADLALSFPRIRMSPNSMNWPSKYFRLTPRQTALAAVAATAVVPLYLIVRYLLVPLGPQPSLRTFAGNYFQVPGAVAIHLLWLQIIIGMNQRRLIPLFPKIFRVHRFIGIAALIAALLHPLLLLVALGPAKYLTFAFVPQQLVPYVIAAEAAVLLLLLTVISALLQHRPFFAKRWRALHLLNYLVFFLIWWHGWGIGLPSRVPLAAALWIFYGLTAYTAIILRYGPAKPPLVQATTTPLAPTGLKVCAVSEVTEGKPFCAQVSGQKLAIFRIGPSFYALDNLCTHQGGPICEGPTQDGRVTCPWHGSEFDVKTGQVINGPAKLGPRTYPLEVRGQYIYLKKGVALRPATAKPTPATLIPDAPFDPAQPFSHRPFLDDIVDRLKFPFKLYGVIGAVLIGQSADEVDFHLGPIHLTRQDIGHLEKLVQSLSAQWHTDVSYCIYHTSQFPDDLILNIRGPKAPDNTAADIKF